MVALDRTAARYMYITIYRTIYASVSIPQGRGWYIEWWCTMCKSVSRCASGVCKCMRMHMFVHRDTTQTPTHAHACVCTRAHMRAHMPQPATTCRIPPCTTIIILLMIEMFQDAILPVFNSTIVAGRLYRGWVGCTVSREACKSTRATSSQRMQTDTRSMLAPTR